VEEEVVVEVGDPLEVYRLGVEEGGLDDLHLSEAVLFHFLVEEVGVEVWDDPVVLVFQEVLDGLGVWDYQVVLVYLAEGPCRHQEAL
jgi:hypothetical protein